MTAVDCPACNGLGGIVVGGHGGPEPECESCERCEGRGYLLRDEPDAEDYDLEAP